MQAETGIDEFLQNGFGVVRRDFLDLHAARGRRHEYDLARRAVEHDAEIEFLIDRAASLRPAGAAPARPSGPVWCVTSVMPRIFSAIGRGLGGVLRDLDAAALAASARMNLRFHNDAPADVLSQPPRLRRR